MTHAELLRNDADLATREGGMYYSGEYLSGIATAAESLEAENVKLQNLVRDVYVLHWHGLDCTECPWVDECDTDGGCPWLSIMHGHMSELGIEV